MSGIWSVGRPTVRRQQFANLGPLLEVCSFGTSLSLQVSLNNRILVRHIVIGHHPFVCLPPHCLVWWSSLNWVGCKLNYLKRLGTLKNAFTHFVVIISRGYSGDTWMLPAMTASWLTHWGPMTASVNWAIIGSGNDLSPIRRQAVTWINADWTPIGHLNHTSVQFKSKYIFIQENVFKNVVCQMSAILFRPHRVDYGRVRQWKASREAIILCAFQSLVFYDSFDCVMVCFSDDEHSCVVWGYIKAGTYKTHSWVL